MTSAVPDRIDLERDRDLAGRGSEVIARRALFGFLLLVPALALFNVFGQRPSTSRAESAAASLKLVAPNHVRGGLLYEARFRVTAHRDLDRATLVLDPGWLESITMNTMEPSPVSESSDNGKLALNLGRIRAGTSHLLFLDFQVNPTNVGRRSQDVSLYDGNTKLLDVHRTITVFP